MTQATKWQIAADEEPLVSDADADSLLAMATDMLAETSDSTDIVMLIVVHRLARTVKAANAKLASVEAWRRDWIHERGDSAMEREFIEMWEPSLSHESDACR